MLEAVALFQQALDERGLRMVLVGGSAVAAWDPAGYVSLDIDLVGTGLQVELDQVFVGEFGFARLGRHWYDERLALAVQCPGTSLDPPGAAVAEIPTPSGAVVMVIAIEDLILDRARQWEATGAYDGWVQAARLDARQLVDRDRLDRRATEVGVDGALAVVRWLAGEHRAGRVIDSPETHAAQRGYLRSGVEGARRGVEVRRAGDV